MKIVVAASDDQWMELTKKSSEIEWLRVNDGSEFAKYKVVDAYFNLKENSFIPDYSVLEKPVIINSVTNTLKELDVPGNVLRMNGWAGFLQRPTWEIAGSITENVSRIFEKLDIKLHAVADEPGFIAARIIAMIINEAYWAVADNVSTKEEIDTAMKLGTNYPFGPFEWAELIGKKNVLELLQKLSVHDQRYQPAALLVSEVNENK